jgi:protein involved in polysaccharide export with SLBB domain
MKGIRKFVLVLFPFLVCACAPAVRNPVPIQESGVMTTATAQEYRINAGDQLDVKFFYNPELNEQVIVRPDGRISLQLANEIMAAGLTPAELTDLLKNTYATEIAKPEITVFVRSFTMQRVFVDGEVYRAGQVALNGPMTVLQSISQAGGMKDSARPDEIIVIRKNGKNKLMTMVVNLEQALDNSDTSQDIPLKPNDIVFVPRSKIANVNVWVDRYIRRNIPLTPSLGYDFN